MKIVCISDTHNQYMAKRLSVPDGDILIHTGDYTGGNGILEFPAFLTWLSNLPHKYKIIVAGNHDWFMYNHKQLMLMTLKAHPNIFYLENESVEIEGIKIYGTPVQPMFMGWAFNYPPEKRREYYNKIPEDTDILATHCPPKDILDWCPRGGNVGCEILRDEIFGRIKPKLHVFGHIHESYGIKTINDITFINASVLNGQYKLKNDPIVFNYK